MNHCCAEMLLVFTAAQATADTRSICKIVNSYLSAPRDHCLVCGSVAGLVPKWLGLVKPGRPIHESGAVLADIIQRLVVGSIS